MADRNSLHEGFLHGIDLFNEQKFFECHEVLEEVWNVAAREERAFLQGLIQLAVGFHHWTRDNRRGAESVLRRGLHNLDRYGAVHGGVALAGLCDHVRAFLARPDVPQPFPRIQLTVDS